MAYNTSTDLTYTRTVGTSNATWVINPPPGTSKCRVFDINASVTTSFVGPTTAATIGIGVTGNLSVLGTLAFGTTTTPAAANTALGWGAQYNRSTSTQGGSTANNPVIGTLEVVTGGSNTINTNINNLYNPVYEVAGPITITYTAPTGTGAAGAAIVDVTLLWF